MAKNRISYIFSPHSPQVLQFFAIFSVDTSTREKTSVKIICQLNVNFHSFSNAITVFFCVNLEERFKFLLHKLEKCFLVLCNDVEYFVVVQLVQIFFHYGHTHVSFPRTCFPNNVFERILLVVNHPLLLRTESVCITKRVFAVISPTKL